MGDTINIVRHPITGKPVEATDVCYSPDDNGWWFSRANFETMKGATSKKVYRDKETAMKAYRANKVVWEWH